MRTLMLSTTALLTMIPAAAWAQTPAAPDQKERPGEAPAPDQDNVGTDAPTAGSTTTAAANTQDAAPESGIADIVVTAQRRSERIQDVPIAISAFSSTQLAAQGVGNTLQLGQYVPNLVAINNTGIGSANAYFLRGLGNTETIATFDPPVGTYVDDVYLSRQNANNLNLFDVERVEVLRGPQGTLFGRNTTGGAISVIMRKPGYQIGGYGELGYGSFAKKLVRGSIDLPVLDDQIALKLSGYWQDDKGYAKNTTTGQRVNDDDGYGIRAAVRVDPSDNFRWNAAWAYIVASGENFLNFECDPRNPTDCDGRFVTTGLIEGLRLETSPYAPLNIRGRKSRFGLGQRAGTNLVTSTMEFDVAPRTTLAAITGYVALDQRFGIDFFDGRGGPSLAVPAPYADFNAPAVPVRGFPRGGFTILNDGVHRQFSQELKLNGVIGDDFINYVAGVYYLKERNRTDFADVFSIFSPAVPGGIGLLLADRTLRNTTTAYAGYVQADLNLTRELTVTAGIRYTDESKRVRFSDNRPSCNDGTVEATCIDNRNLISPSGRPIPTSQSAKLWTPRLAINYKPNRDLLLFASATRGFKSGGWNARGTVNNQLLPFGPEKVWSYEAGFKSELINRLVRLNVTAFQMNVTDLQTPSALVAANGSITFITRNFADYRNRGVEAEFQTQPLTGLNLYANVGYQKDKYRFGGDRAPVDIYGIQSVPAQSAACLAQLAAGNVPGSTGAPACAAGIVGPTGAISTPVRTPDWTLAIGGSYRLPLGASGLSLTPSLNGSYRGNTEVGTSNLSFFDAPSSGINGTFPSNTLSNGRFITGSYSPASWIVNASLALRGEDNRWSLTAECANCLDQERIESTLANYSYLNYPRTWMLRGRVNF